MPLSTCCAPPTLSIRGQSPISNVKKQHQINAELPHFQKYVRKYMHLRVSNKLSLLCVSSLSPQNFIFYQWTEKENDVLFNSVQLQKK